MEELQLHLLLLESLFLPYLLACQQVYQLASVRRHFLRLRHQLCLRLGPELQVRHLVLRLDLR
jgi:hypothetical protein